MLAYQQFQCGVTLSALGVQGGTAMDGGRSGKDVGERTLQPRRRALVQCVQVLPHRRHHGRGDAPRSSDCVDGGGGQLEVADAGLPAIARDAKRQDTPTYLGRRLDEFEPVWPRRVEHGNAAGGDDAPTVVLLAVARTVQL